VFSLPSPKTPSEPSNVLPILRQLNNSPFLPFDSLLRLWNRDPGEGCTCCVCLPTNCLVPKIPETSCDALRLYYFSITYQQHICAVSFKSAESLVNKQGSASIWRGKHLVASQDYPGIHPHLVSTRLCLFTHLAFLCFQNATDLSSVLRAASSHQIKSLSLEPWSLKTERTKGPNFMFVSRWLVQNGATTRKRLGNPGTNAVIAHCSLHETRTCCDCKQG
jgi:hypothetical protein